MLINIKPEKLSAKRNVKIKNFPGSSTIDLKDHINPTIRRNVDTITIHAGTNDITNDIDTISNMQEIVNRIQKKSPRNKIAVSSIIIRKDSQII